MIGSAQSAEQEKKHLRNNKKNNTGKVYKEMKTVT
jgi:hypothetical protein